MKIGVLVLLDSVEIDEKFKKVQELGFNYCQLCCWDQAFMTDEIAEEIKKASKKYDVEVTTFWCGWSAGAQWNFYEGPLTLGLVPAEYRYERMKELKNGSDFAKKIEVKNLATHVGFLPEVPYSQQYQEVVCAIRHIAEHCKKNDQYFLFETGQETPITLKRTIQDIGTDNLGINLDPANLILYGKGNPVDALDVFGEYVRGIHGKDGVYPTDGYELGKEVRIGDGKVNYPMFIKRLKEVGYDGAITIEREIDGDEQIKDILYAKEYLEKLI